LREPTRDARIRRANHADIPRIHEIRSQARENRLSDPAAVTPEDIVWFIENPGIWVWDEGGRLKGFSAADTRDATVWALFVDPAHEGEGVGRALFQAALDTLRDAGHRSATLSTDPGTRAELFYRSAGWTAVGRTAKGELLFQSSL
jgi:GNAT superfamily N-acetyltransferase